MAVATLDQLARQLADGKVSSRHLVEASLAAITAAHERH